jgi:ADP-ribosylglycohydrolase
VIGDALGAPTEGKSPAEIDRRFGWVDDFESGGTDDTVLRDILARTLTRTSGYATIDDWADDWLAGWDEIFGPKQNRFFLSVLHTARRLRVQGEPRMAALGNIPCSSSAMCIAPVGLVNACNPAQAAAQATHLASLINVQDAGFCQDGAAIVAAAVAAACRPDATVESIVQQALAPVPATSGARMLAGVQQALDAIRQRDYADFRAYAHKHKEQFFQVRKANSLETVPLTLALFSLAGGDVERCVTYAANFGGDTDTMAAMAGAIAGAFGGVGSIRPDWVEKAKRNADQNQEELARGLTTAAVTKLDRERAAGTALSTLLT